MGWRDALRIGTGGASLPPVELLSPWADTSNLSTIVWADLLDVDLLPMTRAEAMAVPAAARARHLLCGTIAGLPLVALRGSEQLTGPDAPSWTYRSDGPVSPWHRMLWTVDDVLWHGWSLWAVDRGADGFVLDATRVPFDAWKFDDAGRVVLGESQTPAAAADVILIPGPHEGLLSFASRTLRQASKLERAAARHAANPVPSIALEQTVDVVLSDQERADLIAGWVSARSSSDGAVGFTSYGIKATPLGAVPEQLLIDGRNAAAVDVARHASIPAAMLDATTAGASLTYETTQGRNGQFLDYGVGLYLEAISQRLSLDDVVPRGTRIAFDTSSLTSLSDAATGPTLPD